MDLINKDGIWYGKQGNYWSYISQKEHSLFAQHLREESAYEVMKKYFPQHEEEFSSPGRMGGVASLNISKDDVILDAGCMWGAVTIPLARTGAKIFAIDQTEQSLLFLKRRKQDEGLTNLEIICADLNQQKLQEQFYTKVIVNDVLEWIPCIDDFEANSSENKHQKGKKHSASPYEMQKNFLKKMHDSLKEGGTLYLAIENRYNLSYFLGLPESHCNIRFFSILPRFAQDIVHSVLRGSKFRNWTYSKTGLRNLLKRAGFKNIKISYAFPGHRNPVIVLNNLNLKEFYQYFYHPYSSLLGDKLWFMKILIRGMEFIFYKTLKLMFFSPSFVIHAEK